MERSEADGDGALKFSPAVASALWVQSSFLPTSAQRRMQRTIVNPPRIPRIPPPPLCLPVMTSWRTLPRDQQLVIDTSPSETPLILSPERHDLLRQRQLLRRSKSHSPSRRSPKLRHTNGRLEADEGLTSRLAILRPMLLIPSGGRGRRAATDPAATRCQSRQNAPAISGAAEAIAKPVDWASLHDQRRIKIEYRDESLRESCASNTRRMLVTAIRSSKAETSASSSSSSRSSLTGGFKAKAAATKSTKINVKSNQQTLAMKALKYRKVLDRMGSLDQAQLADPSFDILSFMGAQWCKR